MASKILVIEADDAFASHLASAFERRGAEVITTGEGKEGLRLAQEAGPDAVVLCVELPRMSGYAVCNKLKKSEDLRSIPLVITSSEATEKTFEQHRKLKTRAEGYVLKPCSADDIVDAVAPFVTLEPATGGDEVEAVDEDLELLEDAFDALSLEDEEEEEEEPVVEEMDGDDLSVEVLDDLDASVEVVDDDEEPDALAIGGDAADDSSEDDLLEDFEQDEDDFGDLLGGLEAEPGSDGTEAAEAAVEALGGEDDAVEPLRRERDDLRRRLEAAEAALRERTRELESARAASPGSGSPKEVLRLKSELTGRDRDILALKEALNEKEKAVLEAQDRENALELRVADLEEAARDREGADRDRAGEVEALQQELASLRERAERAEAEAQRHEGRLVEAYRRLKADEALRERTRKALGVALQLLDTSPESLLGESGEPARGRDAGDDDDLDAAAAALADLEIESA